MSETVERSESVGEMRELCAGEEIPVEFTNTPVYPNNTFEEFMHLAAARMREAAIRHARLMCARPDRIVCNLGHYNWFKEVDRTITIRFKYYVGEHDYLHYVPLPDFRCSGDVA